MSNRFPVPQDVQDNPYFWKHVGDEMAYSPEFSKVQQAVRVWHMEYQNRDQLIVCEVCGGNGYWRPTVGAHWCIDGGHPARKRNNRKVAS